MDGWITEMEESKPNQWNETDGEIGPSLELPVAPNTAQLEQREIYKAPLKREAQLLLPYFLKPYSDFFPIPSHSLVPFCTFNLDHPNRSITHVRLV